MLMYSMAKYSSSCSLKIITIIEISLDTQRWNSHVIVLTFNPLTAGVAYSRVFIFFQHIKYHILNMLNIKCDINQQDLKRVDLHSVKSE